MKQKTLYTLFMISCIVVAALTAYGKALAAVKLCDDRLVLNGFIKESAYVRTSMQDREEEFHDMELDFFRTSILFESLYAIKESEDLTVRFFGGLKWWYEAAPRLDDNLRRHIPYRFRKDYVSPRSAEDVVTECYLNVIKDPWELRIGKQIVIWGDLDIDRAADVVNPLDLRHGMPGLDTWEEIKQGLWMMRLFYQSKLPGNLLFEGILNPGDYKMVLLPDEGTHFGPPYHASNPFNQYADGFGLVHWLFEKMRDDAPEYSFKNYEFGFRVRGYTWDIDWTLLYYNSLQDAPIIDPNRALPFTLTYFIDAIRAAFRGGTIDPDWPIYRVFKYKRAEVIGGTAQKYLSQGWAIRGSVLKLEWFYEIGTPFNKGPRGSSTGVYSETRRDVLGIAVNWWQKFNIPGLTQTWLCTGKQFEISLTYFWERIFNDDHDLVKDARYHRPGDSSAESISLWFMQAMLNQNLNLVFNGFYKPRIDKWMAIPSLQYVFPGRHWRAEFGVALYGGAKNDYTHSYYDHKDSILLRLRYEW